MVTLSLPEASVKVTESSSTTTSFAFARKEVRRASAAAELSVSDGASVVTSAEPVVTASEEVEGVVLSESPVPVQETSAPSIRATARIRVKIFFIGICYPFLVEHLYHPPKREDIIRE